MDFELDATTIGLTVAMYLFCMVVVWKPFFGDGLPFQTKVLATILMVPLSYAMVNWQLNNRG